MAKYLVIVESPAKAKTINKFLGSNYRVVASNGHVRDLPKSQLGIDIENDFEPKYITIRGKGDILAMLRKEVKKADKVYLATDPDREGEAISWHLAQALKLEQKQIHRITFNEITKTAVKNSIKQARNIDMDLVDAQQARRMLDRMVGYKISPLLWIKVKRGLSAGRVQSVALRIICDREQEIDSFISEEYWTLDVLLDVKGEKRKNWKFIPKRSWITFWRIWKVIRIRFIILKMENGQKNRPFLLQRVHYSRRLQNCLIFPHRKRCVLLSSCMRVWISKAMGQSA